MGLEACASMPHMPSENIVNMVKTIHKRYHFQAGQMTQQALVFQPERQSWAEGENGPVQALEGTSAPTELLQL